MIIGPEPEDLEKALQFINSFVADESDNLPEEMDLGRAAVLKKIKRKMQQEQISEKISALEESSPGPGISVTVGEKDKAQSFQIPVEKVFEFTTLITDLAEFQTKKGKTIDVQKGTVIPLYTYDEAIDGSPSKPAILYDYDETLTTTYHTHLRMKEIAFKRDTAIRQADEALVPELEEFIKTSKDTKIQEAIGAFLKAEKELKLHVMVYKDTLIVLSEKADASRQAMIGLEVGTPAYEKAKKAYQEVLRAFQFNLKERNEKLAAFQKKRESVLRDLQNLAEQEPYQANLKFVIRHREVVEGAKKEAEADFEQMKSVTLEDIRDRFHFFYSHFKHKDKVGILSHNAGPGGLSNDNGSSFALGAEQPDEFIKNMLIAACRAGCDDSELSIKLGMTAQDKKEFMEWIGEIPIHANLRLAINGWETRDEQAHDMMEALGAQGFILVDDSRDNILLTDAHDPRMKMIRVIRGAKGQELSIPGRTTDAHTSIISPKAVHQLREVINEQQKVIAQHPKEEVTQQQKRNLSALISDPSYGGSEISREEVEDLLRQDYNSSDNLKLNPGDRTRRCLFRSCSHPFAKRNANPSVEYFSVWFLSLSQAKSGEAPIVAEEIMRYNKYDGSILAMNPVKKNSPEEVDDLTPAIKDTATSTPVSFPNLDALRTVYKGGSLDVKVALAAVKSSAQAHPLPSDQVTASSAPPLAAPKEMPTVDSIKNSGFYIEIASDEALKEIEGNKNAIILTKSSTPSTADVFNFTICYTDNDGNIKGSKGANKIKAWLKNEKIFVTATEGKPPLEFSNLEHLISTFKPLDLTLSPMASKQLPGKTEAYRTLLKETSVLPVTVIPVKTPEVTKPPEVTPVSAPSVAAAVPPTTTTTTAAPEQPSAQESATVTPLNPTTPEVSTTPVAAVTPLAPAAPEVTAAPAEAATPPTPLLRKFVAPRPKQPATAAPPIIPTAPTTTVTTAAPATPTVTTAATETPEATTQPPPQAAPAAAQKPAAETIQRSATPPKVLRPLPPLKPKAVQAPPSPPVPERPPAPPPPPTRPRSDALVPPVRFSPESLESLRRIKGGRQLPGLKPPEPDKTSKDKPHEPDKTSPKKKGWHPFS